MSYVNQVVHGCGLYKQGGSGLWAILTEWFKTVDYINQEVKDCGLY